MASKARTPRVVEDLAGGEFARVAAGLVRITQRVDRHTGVRDAILLRPDLTELPMPGSLVHLSPRECVEVLPRPEHDAADRGGADEVDPLRGES